MQSVHANYGIPWNSTTTTTNTTISIDAATIAAAFTLILKNLRHIDTAADVMS